MIADATNVNVSHTTFILLTLPRSGQAGELSLISSRLLELTLAMTRFFALAFVCLAFLPAAKAASDPSDPGVEFFE
jgi:hypothetical protein